MDQPSPMVEGVDLSGPMIKIQASSRAFAAIAADGHVVAWGAGDRGGLVPPDVSLGGDGKPWR